MCQGKKKTDDRKVVMWSEPEGPIPGPLWVEARLRDRLRHWNCETGEERNAGWPGPGQKLN